MRDDNNAQGTATCSPLLRPFLGERHMQPLAKQTLSVKIGAVNSPAGKSRCKVAFFPGCMGDKMYVDMRKLPQGAAASQGSRIHAQGTCLLRHSGAFLRRRQGHGRADEDQPGTAGTGQL